MTIPHSDNDQPPLGVLPSGKLYLKNSQRTMNLPNFQHAQVNHYALRSADSFLIRWACGRANHSNHILRAPYLHRFNLNDVVEDSICQYYISAGAWMESSKVTLSYMIFT
jgi:hypothetical protein